MMRNDNIRARIKELERETLEEAGDIAQVVYGDDARRPDALEQLADAGGGQRLLDFGDALVYIKPTSEWSPEERAAVKAVRQTRTKEGVSVEVQMYDKTAALKLLAEITGLTKQPIGLSVGDTAPVSMNIVFGEAASGYEANGYEASTTLESGS